MYCINKTFSGIYRNVLNYLYRYQYQIFYFDLAGPYAFAKKGEICADVAGLKHIQTLEECEASEEFIKSVYPEADGGVSEEEEEDYPIGCYVNNDGIYFNNHEVGGRDDDSIQLCKSVIEADGNNLKILNFQPTFY